jgi:adenosylcobinamide kinase/adenosylcobinamide-phosphate guanylyltransferase
MILVVGGLGSGKRDYVLNALGYDEADMAPAVLDERPVLLDLHELIRAEGGFQETWFAHLCAKAVVVCGEVGCGVVPLDGSERLWREEVGRASTRLAAEAQAVVRLVCGLPHILKGELP